MRVENSCSHVQECQRIGSVESSLDARMGMHVNFKSYERITWGFFVKLSSHSHDIMFLVGDCGTGHPQIRRSRMPDDGHERRAGASSTNLVDS